VLIIIFFPQYNIVSDILYYVVICVEFLGTHMACASLVFFAKLGATWECVKNRPAGSTCSLTSCFKIEICSAPALSAFAPRN
jgi:hypothetical protein